MPRPHLRRLQREELPDAMRESWDRSTAVRGDACFVEVAGNAPELFEWYAGFYRDVFHGGRVDPALKELLRYRLSTLHGCRHCNLGNRRDALAAGIAEEKLDAIDTPGSALFTERERAALTVCEEMALTNPGGSLGADAYRQLREHFDDAQVFEIGLTLGILTGMAKFLFVYDLVEREASCPFPPAGSV